MSRSPAGWRQSPRGALSCRRAFLQESPRRELPTSGVTRELSKRRWNAPSHSSRTSPDDGMTLGKRARVEGANDLEGRGVQPVREVRRDGGELPRVDAA